MRALGFRKFEIRRLFFYEALILVLSACLLGMMIGLTVAYTMALQMNLFMGTETKLDFP